MLSLQEIIAAPGLTPFAVACPEWGGDVWLLPMSGEDLDAWDQEQSRRKWPHDDKGNPLEGDWRGLRAFAVARQVCDESGQRFGPSDADILALSKKSGAVLNRLFRALQEKSGLLADAVEDAEKNSPPGQTGSSG